jgi:hypothetical protein
MSGLTVTGATLHAEAVGLRCTDGVIAAIGPEVAPEPGEETIDASGMPLVPALANGHTHAAMTLFRGYGGDLPLMRWLQERIWPVEAKLEARLRGKRLGRRHHRRRRPGADAGRPGRGHGRGRRPRRRAGATARDRLNRRKTVAYQRWKGRPGGV